MISIGIISKRPEISEATKAYTQFLGWECNILSQELKLHISSLACDIVIVSEEELSPRQLDMILDKVRKNNPFKPIIVICSSQSNQYEDITFKSKPFFICKSPFSSKDFVKQLIAAKQYCELAKAASAKLGRLYATIPEPKQSQRKAQIQKENATSKTKDKDINTIDTKKESLIAGIIDGSITTVKCTDKNRTKKTIEIAKLCNSKAIALVQAKKFALAEKLYQNTIRLLPDKQIEYKLWMNLGLCMKKAKNFTKARKYFEIGERKCPPKYKRFTEQIKSLNRGS